MSKILFFLLIGCTLALGFPVDQTNKDGKVAFQSDGIIANIIKSFFGKVPEMISESIKVSLEKVFAEISKRLNTEEYKKAMTELQNILQRINWNNGELPNVAEEDRKAIKQAVEKVEGAFGKAIQAAAVGIINKNEDKVDTSEFIEAVHNLKTLVDKIYANQGTN